ncbi:HTH domain-containing protein [Paenibacillus tianmuensis]|uniref:HTH domain-containing protein n=1 Tax=Paenibacillus tianmuensis TaxID=624147 RepID=UPI000B82E444
MRADRLISIIMLLQLHKSMTAKDPAERLEVSIRTIQRDMEALSTAGPPRRRGPWHRGRLATAGRLQSPNAAKRTLRTRTPPPAPPPASKRPARLGIGKRGADGVP